MIFQGCKLIHDFLAEDEENVVVIHCVHGKGRTGSLVCAYLMYCGLADSAQNALVYFREKRYYKPIKGMKHVCQLRYLHYF